jgi:hypothetical protein
MNENSNNLQGDSSEDRYFRMIHDLESKNDSRYHDQAMQILRNKILNVDFQGTTIRYEMTWNGCKSHIIESSGLSISNFWSRMGWRKSSKLKALPNFFAQAEASVLLNGLK